MSEPTGPERSGAFVLMMGTVTLFGTMAYEGARALLGPFLALLGVGGATVGFVAGFGEFLGYGARVFTGIIGEKTRAYWGLVFFGYLINFVAVPGLGWAGDWEAVVALIWAERFAKALRSPARTALATHTADDSQLGRRYGFEVAFDHLGAVLGPVLAVFGLWYSESAPGLLQHRDAFKVLAAPALAALALVFVARSRFPKVAAASTVRAGPPLGRDYRLLLLGGALLGFGSADWALLSFHGAITHEVSFGVVPAIYAAAMVSAGAAALAFGRLFDRFGPAMLTAVALLSAGATPLVFRVPVLAAFAGGAVLWGLSVGAQESVFKAAIGRVVGPEQRVRALGIFFAVYGLAWWAGSTAMGWLYQHSPAQLVWVAAGAQLVAAPVFLLLGRRR